MVNEDVKTITKKEAEKRIKQLREAINYHSYRYHVLDQPEISDAAFDSLKHKLHQLEQKFPDLITPDSPTQRVSGQPLEKFEKVHHRKPMLSLEDVFSAEELSEWQTRIGKVAQEKGLAEKFKKTNYFAELKIDGFAITLIYQKGRFVQGATRGNGRVGEDVTQNLKTINSIPLAIKIHGKLPNRKIEKKVKQLLTKGRIEVRGEVYMSKKAFEKVNQERKEKGLPLYANPRNLAAGSIRQLDPQVAASRELDFLAYDVVTDLGQKTHEEEHEITRALGFKTDQGKIFDDLKEVVKFREKVSRLRERLPYQIDGIVINVNDNELFEKLGVAGKAPRGAIAFKFPGKEETTRVKDIVVQVGRTGILTPVAILEPVQIGGTTITRATLHNAEEIKRLDVRIGDTVVVERAGDVIPHIVKVIKEMRTGEEKKFQMPSRCPVCGSKVIKKESEVYYRCSNSNCGARHRQELIHFVSKKGFDIEGLGPKIVEQLMDEGLISDLADIFYLTKGDLIPLERFAEKSADNLIKAIEKSKKISLVNFINALNIPGVGEETSLLLVRQLQKKNPHLVRLDDFIKLMKSFSLEELQEIKDIGPVVGNSIYQWFRSKKNLALIEKLKKAGIEILTPRFKRQSKLKGKTFVFTGELSTLTREEAKDKVREQGGEVSTTVSRQTDFIVVGKKPGIKYKQAQKLGLRIIKEEEFLKMIR